MSRKLDKDTVCLVVPAVHRFKSRRHGVTRGGNNSWQRTRILRLFFFCSICKCQKMQEGSDPAPADATVSRPSDLLRLQSQVADIVSDFTEN
jgi:hypothetical protein